MSYERISGPLHVGDWFGKTVGRPMILGARAYARLRYGIDLLKPSPLAALTHSSVPVLLIHGTEDQVISPHHSEILAHAAPLSCATLARAPRLAHRRLERRTR